METRTLMFAPNLDSSACLFVTNRIYKAYFRTRKLYPNINRSKVKDHVFANRDYFHKNVKVQKERNYEQLEGGIVGHLEVPWNFHAKSDEDDVVGIAIACEMKDSLFRSEFTWSDKRSHIRFAVRRKALYFPLVHNVISVPSVSGSYYVNENRRFIRPDFTFVKEAERALKIWILHMETSDFQTESIHFNPGFINLRLLAPAMRDTVVRHLAKTFKQQRNLKMLTFEFAYLDSTDALRILVAAALGAGHTLQKLYLCNLFYPGFLPLETEADYFDVYDDLDYDPLNLATYSDEIKSKTWEKLFLSPFLGRMPLLAFDKYFGMALSSLSNLTVLMVNYSWLSKGNGFYLLRLECIRNANLRKLILVITPSEDTNKSQQVISQKAWSYAVRMCPCLELHLILIETAEFIDVKQVLVTKMPLVSVHFSNTFPSEGYAKRKIWSFSYFSRYLCSYFSNTLEIINLTVWRPSCLVDKCLANMILKCNLLRVFIYRGNMDRISSINAILEVLLDDNKMRIKEIGFFIVDDPCRPEGWSEAVEEIKNKYTSPLALKGITVSLGLWKF